MSILLLLSDVIVQENWTSKFYLRNKNQFGINNRIGSLVNYRFWKIRPNTTTTSNLSSFYGVICESGEQTYVFRF